MILYDLKTDSIFNILSFNIESQYNNQLYPTTMASGVNYNTRFLEEKITLKLPVNMLSYIKDWQNQMYDYATGECSTPNSYKRDIIITELEQKKSGYSADTKLHGAFPKSLNYGKNYLEVELNIDYNEIGFFPEVKTILRDKKINQILD
jgi:hypothetical protein